MAMTAAAVVLYALYDRFVIDEAYIPNTEAGLAAHGRFI